MRTLFMFLLLLCAIVPAHAANRAFVVGVDRYDSLGPEKQLTRAVNDARAVAAALKPLGFTVKSIENPTRRDLNTAWQDFLNGITAGDTIAVFFAGHGVQIGGLNYLIPRDVPNLTGNDETLLRDEAISLQKLMDDAKARAPRISLMIIDACRNNPFTLPGGRSLGGVQRGLARIEPPRGSFVILSAGAGETALDRLPGSDPETTSVFTRSLVPLLARRDLTLQQLAVEVRQSVSVLAAKANHPQTPAYWDELSGPAVCLTGTCAQGNGKLPPDRPPPPAPVDPDASLLAVIATLSDRAALEQLTRHQSQIVRGAARTRLAALPNNPPPSPPPPPAEPKYWRTGGGSVLELRTNGDTVAMTFAEPNTRARQDGVAVGQMYFTGRRSGIKAEGRLRFTTNNCSFEPSAALTFAAKSITVDIAAHGAACGQPSWYAGTFLLEPVANFTPSATGSPANSSGSSMVPPSQQPSRQPSCNDPDYNVFLDPLGCNKPHAFDERWKKR